MKRLIVLLLIGIPFISSAAETEVYLEFRYINNCWLNGEKIIPSTGGDVILSFSQVSQTYDLMSLINYDIMQAGPLVKETIHLIFANYSESERLGQAVFEIQANNSGDVYIYKFQGGNDIVTLTQFPVGTPSSSIHDITNTDPVKIIPAEETTISLDGSDEGVQYMLIQNGNRVIDTQYGTGEPIAFTGFYEEGIYTVRSQYDQQMNGAKTISYYNCVSEYLVNLGSIQLDANGGEYFVLGPYEDRDVIDELDQIFIKLNALYYENESNILFSIYSSDSHVIKIRLLCGPNLTGADIYMDTYIRNSANSNQTFIVTQPQASLISYKLSGEFNDELQSYTRMSLSGSQFQVQYDLLCDGRLVESVTGTGNPIIFKNIFLSGTYTSTARYGSSELPMSGSLTQKVSLITTPQSSWMLQQIYTQPGGKGEIQNITYYNGLGLPWQQIAIQASPSLHNIVTPVYYDASLRDDSRVYKPYTSETQTAEREISPLDSSNFVKNYGAEDAQYAYVQQEYELSPLNRVTKNYKAGVAFQGDSKHYQSYGYDVNCRDEVRKILPTNDSLCLAGYYTAGTLSVQTITDEAGLVRKSYTDLSGHVVLERTIGGTEIHDTYYVYDYQGLPIWVIPPEASAQLQNATYSPDSDLVKKYCYRYSYDGRGNTIRKRLPGREYEIFRYDAGNRPIAYQDGNMRKRNSDWIIYEYDALGREIKRSRLSNKNEAEIDSIIELGTLYSNELTLLIETGYDTSRSEALRFTTVDEIVSTSDITTSPKGLKTYEKLGLLADDGIIPEYIERAFFYDDKGRPVQSTEIDAEGRVLRISTKYDFTGTPIRQQESYDYDILDKSFVYDQRGRLLTETSQINGGARAVISYTYDEVGRLSGKTYGSEPGSIRETMDYDINDWLTSKSSSLFDMKLRYYTPELGATALYTGDIAEWQWQHKMLNDGSDGTDHTYRFIYDPFARLQEAVKYNGTQPIDDFSECCISYDRNGNLISLMRMAKGDLINDYWYINDGNQLETLMDANGEYQYRYDANGNCSCDGRQYVDISYNLINLPACVSDGGGDRAVYTYLTDGTKYKVLDYAGSGYLYRGSFIYNAGSVTDLESVSFSDGRIYRTSGIDEICYHITDHLGSVRATVNQWGQVSNRSDYYPLGLRYDEEDIATTNRYLYNGKEKQVVGDLDYLDYGARNYDPQIGRWSTQDPLAEKYYLDSPDTFCTENPTTFIDPDDTK